MAKPAAEASPPGLIESERTIFFTDAIVAIAITLLVLPALETIPAAAEENVQAAEWLGANLGLLIAFAVSFAVIASFWVQHRRLFTDVTRLTTSVLVVDMAWAFTIVFLQLPSALIYTLPNDGWAAGLYMGTMALNEALLAVMAWLIGRDQRLFADGKYEPTRPRIYALVAALFVVAFVLAVALPGLGYLSLTVLWLLPFLLRIRWFQQPVTVKYAA